MSRSELDVIFDRVEALQKEISLHVAKTPATIEFRADLAGLIVVAIAASYESCVKAVLIGYAARHNPEFETFVAYHFQKLNSRVRPSDLYKYARTCSNDVHRKFGELIIDRRKRINTRIGKNIFDAYEQVLSWRHDFAHEGVRNTTIEEAMATHRLAKRVLYAFDEAFR